jgi:hypothetical protein
VGEVELSPDVAGELLAGTEARFVNPGRVTRFDNDIREGITDWGIITFKDGKLADGAHRCWAVILAGTPTR